MGRDEASRQAYDDMMAEREQRRRAKAARRAKRAGGQP
jgi:hypothetical protein